MINDLINNLEQIMDTIKNEEWKESSQTQREELYKRFNGSVYNFSYSDDFILVPATESRIWMYYMGFEYIDEDYIIQLPGYVIFDGNTDRVGEVINLLTEKEDD